MCVAITGATGFIGEVLVQRLARDPIYTPLALSRSNFATVLPGVEYKAVGELSSHTDWRGVLQGVQAVVHSAARVHVDVNVLCGGGTVDRKNVRQIRGSGVDTSVYKYSPESSEAPVVLLASRLLWDKGVGEFVEAAGRIRKQGFPARFVLAGDGDDENPGSISASQLKAWGEEGNVECWGRCADMPSVFAQSHIVCLPTTYGEGVPKVLIEAASCGRPIVTTDTSGCRKLVKDGVNGILVPIRDIDALATAIRTLLNAPELRYRMGHEGRQLVKQKFSLSKVVGETLAIYESMTQ